MDLGTLLEAAKYLEMKEEQEKAEAAAAAAAATASAAAIASTASKTRIIRTPSMSPTRYTLPAPAVSPPLLPLTLQTLKLTSIANIPNINHHQGTPLIFNQHEINNQKQQQQQQQPDQLHVITSTVSPGNNNNTFDIFSPLVIDEGAIYTGDSQLQNQNAGYINSTNTSNNNNSVSSNSSGGGKRRQPPMVFRAGTREVHNKLEKHRRAHLKECFDTLKRQLPSTAHDENKKTSNLSILHSALKCIQALKKRERDLEKEMEELARAKIVSQQRLAVLRRDVVGANFESVDIAKLLPEIIKPLMTPSYKNNNSAITMTTSSTGTKCTPIKELPPEGRGGTAKIFTAAEIKGEIDSGGNLVVVAATAAGTSAPPIIDRLALPLLTAKSITNTTASKEIQSSLVQPASLQTTNTSPSSTTTTQLSAQLVPVGYHPVGAGQSLVLQKLAIVSSSTSTASPAGTSGVVVGGGVGNGGGQQSKTTPEHHHHHHHHHHLTPLTHFIAQQQLNGKVVPLMNAQYVHVKPVVVVSRSSS